jgi:hypothetical protein
MSDDDRTCHGYGPDPHELLEDKPRRCECCGKVLTREEVREHISLCTNCAAVIDRETEAQLEREHFDWFE